MRSIVDYARINNTLGKMEYYLLTHKVISVSISGGSDSDIILHIIATNFRKYLPKIHFVFSNTGVEYRATLDHLDYLEQKYKIKIDRIRGMPIPLAIKKYGVPFLSKIASDYIQRLQRHNFTWCDGEFEDLHAKFGKCQTALQWWCNFWEGKSRFNIDWNRGLKEFLLQEKPQFKISSTCCQKSKKDPLVKYQKEIGADLVITGERKAEKGARAAKTNCFEQSHGLDHYMPLFFWNDETKQYYKEKENIRYSDCYEVYGLKRTGCVGCPFALNRKEELQIMQKYEPNLYNACINIFGDSYVLSDKFAEYKTELKLKEKEEKIAKQSKH